GKGIFMPPPVLSGLPRKVGGCAGYVAASCRLRLHSGQSALLASRYRPAHSNIPQRASAVLAAAFQGSPRGASAAVQTRAATPAAAGPAPPPDRAPAAPATADAAQSTDGSCSKR